jgi:hypothetical protein
MWLTVLLFVRLLEQALSIITHKHITRCWKRLLSTRIIAPKFKNGYVNVIIVRAVLTKVREVSDELHSPSALSPGGQSPWYPLRLSLSLNINIGTTMATMRNFRIVCSSNNTASQNVLLNVISHSWCIPGKATAAPLYLTQTHVTYLPGTIEYTAIQCQRY